MHLTHNLALSSVQKRPKRYLLFLSKYSTMVSHQVQMYCYRDRVPAAPLSSSLSSTFTDSPRNHYESYFGIAQHMLAFSKTHKQKDIYLVSFEQQWLLAPGFRNTGTMVSPNRPLLVQWSLAPGYYQYNGLSHQADMGCHRHRVPAPRLRHFDRAALIRRRRRLHRRRLPRPTKHGQKCLNTIFEHIYSQFCIYLFV